MVLEGPVRSAYIEWLRDTFLLSGVLDAHIPLQQQNSKAELLTLEMVIRFHSLNKMYQIFAMRIGKSYELSLLFLSYKRIEQLDPDGRCPTEIRMQ